MHASSGCDKVSYPFGKGTVSSTNLLLKTDLGLAVMCEPHENENDVVTVGIDVLVRLYGGKPGTNMNNLRYQNFSENKGPKIKILPPSHDAAVLHLKRATRH